MTGEEEFRPSSDPSRAVGGKTAAWNDAMDMGMMRQRLTPCVQDGDEADLGAEPARVRGEHHHCLGGGLEQDGVDSGLVLEGDHRDLRRQREDNVEVGNRKEFSLARGEPSCTGRSLALRTVPVAAGVVGDPRHAAVSRRPRRDRRAPPSGTR